VDRRSPRYDDVSTDSSPPQLSILVPTLDEEARIEHSIRTVRASLAYGDVRGEIIVCDGGSCDETVAIAERVGVEAVVSAPAGRARQLNRGAERAAGEGLVFLHADALVPADWAAAIWRELEAGADGGWCEIEVVPETASGVAANGLPAVAAGINWRTRVFETATAEQSMFVRRSSFESLDGLPELPIMEGAEMASRLREYGSTSVVETTVRVSGRRWEHTGLVGSTMAMYAVRIGYMCGVAPGRLREFWRWSTGTQ